MNLNQIQPAIRPEHQVLLDNLAKIVTNSEAKIENGKLYWRERNRPDATWSESSFTLNHLMLMHGPGTSVR